MTTTVSTLHGFRFERRDDANNTNLADKDQPVIVVQFPSGYRQLMGRWTTLCGADQGGLTITADKATDAQIVYAVTNDESVFAEEGN